MPTSKLIRDKIPQMIADKSEAFKVCVVGGSELLRALDNKIHEEVKELLALEADISEESADVLEVMISRIFHSKGITREKALDQILAALEDKYQSR